MIQQDWKHTQDGFKSIFNQFDDKANFCLATCGEEVLIIFSTFLLLQFKNKNKIFQNHFNPYIFRLYF